MTKILKLSKEDTIQIGSSQVILSIKQAVKELVENSLDAKSSKIEVKLHEFGKKITVKDDGIGIDIKDHLVLCKRNQTSKLVDFDDLETVSTFGYRGEALNSLCCTCNVVIITARDPPMGQKLEFNHLGELISSVSTAHARGSTRLIRDDCAS